MAPCPFWLVVGGESTGGVIVRRRKGTASERFPERLCTGALVRELKFAEEARRLLFERVTGTGPECGWVTTRVAEKDLMERTSEGWRVVAGGERGGLVVREGKETSSPASTERLCTGAVVQELELDPQSSRLRFRKVSGCGPSTGWVSTRASASDMLVRLQEWDSMENSLPMIDLGQAGSVDQVCVAARKCRRALLKLVEDVGGILVSAPALRGPEDFGKCLKEVVGHGLSDKYSGLLNRRKVAEFVFNTTTAPTNMPVPGHTELSYMPASKPDYIAFFCEEAPQGSGGQTPAIDMRAVLNDLPPELLRRFRGGVRCAKNLPPDAGAFLIPSQLDPSGPRFRLLNRSWKKLSPDREEAAAMVISNARASGVTVYVDWEGDWMRCFEPMPAIAPHPVTGEELWTGYNPRFHWFGTLSQALFDVAYHNRTMRQVLVTGAVALSTAAFAACRLVAKVPKLRKRMPDFLSSPGTTSSMLEDGSPISCWDAFRIVRCYNRHLLCWRWRPGLFALLDNNRLGHLRTPYDPHESRKVYTAFGSKAPAGAAKL